MKRILKIIIIIFLSVSYITLLKSCKKKTEPIVTTDNITAFTQTTASSGGNVTSNGGAKVTARGVCWSTTNNPPFGPNSTSDGTGNGHFNSNIEGLTPNTKYYVRAYAINSEGTGYGNQVDFTTLENPPIAAFTASSTTITAGQSVQFTDQSTNNPTSWSWNFGDGSISTSNSPAHTYSTAGTYTVSLTVSNNYGSDAEIKVNFITVLPLRVTDIDNNIYGTVTIGSQVWMAENLKTTRFNDGNGIPLVTTNAGWINLSTPGFCYYDNNESLYKEIYGALYNWYAVYNGKICPAGWHVPSDEEWKTLEMYLGMSREVADLTLYRGTNEGSKLKSASGWNQNGNGTNETGFTGLPGGLRGYDGIFYYVGNWTDFWTSTEINSNNAYTRGLGYIHDNIGRYEDSKKLGVSIRCIKNN